MVKKFGILSKLAQILSITLIVPVAACFTDKK